jgi:uncharacterized membrane protein
MPNGHSTHQVALAATTAVQKTRAHIYKQRLLIIALVMLVSLLYGCGGPVIDASSDQSMQASIEHIRTALTDENRAAFDRALIDLNDMLFNRTDAVSQATIGLYRPEALIRKILHNKTAGDVIDMVEKHRQKLREK